MTELVDLNSLALDDLYRALSLGGLSRRLFELMRDEDLGAGTRTLGDVTSQSCLAAGAEHSGGRLTARLIAREGCRVAGLATIDEMARVFGFEIGVRTLVADGREACPGDVLAELEGRADELLVLERSLLNLVSRLCAVATRTGEYVGAIEREAPGSRAKLYDTRKTTPGARILEKYAVRCGGGMCHRVGLWDAMLIKDNHLAGIGVQSLAGFVRDAAAHARRARPVRFVEVEVDSLTQLEALLTLDRGIIDIILLDNMDEATLRAGVAMRDHAKSTVLLEASGGVSLDTIGAIARSGVERISVGALTHGAGSIDLGLDA